MAYFISGETFLVLLILIVVAGICYAVAVYMWWQEYKRERYMEEWMKLHGPPTEDSKPDTDEEMEK